MICWMRIIALMECHPIRIVNEVVRIGGIFPLFVQIFICDVTANWVGGYKQQLVQYTNLKYRHINSKVLLGL